MKRYFTILLFLFISPLLFSQTTIQKFATAEWNVKLDDFKKAAKGKNLTEQNMGAMAGNNKEAQDMTMFIGDEKIGQMPVKVSYVFYKKELAAKSIAAMSDAKTKDANLKTFKDAGIKLYGSKCEEKDVNGMKVISWKESKKYGAFIMVMGNTITMTIADKTKEPKKQ